MREIFIALRISPILYNIKLFDHRYRTMAAQSIVTKFNRAVQFEKDGDYDKALREYISNYYRLIHHSVSAYLNLGSLYSRMNKFPEAMKCYEAALSLGAGLYHLF